MTEKILKNNQAVVAGEIISDFEFSHEVFGEGFYFVKLKVSRLSHSSDIIPLLVSERLIDVSESHIGQFLEARGHTINELLSLSQRFEVAKMLTDKRTYLDISEKTGASTATISRVNRSLNYGNDGYEMVFSRMKEKETAGKTEE